MRFISVTINQKEKAQLHIICDYGRDYGTIDYESLKRNYYDNKESVITYIKTDGYLLGQ
jgi:hypothetical protein